MYDKHCILCLPVFVFVHVQKLSLVVKTDGSHSLEENMRQTLLACYREFAEILKQMAITHVYLVCLCMCAWCNDLSMCISCQWHTLKMTCYAFSKVSVDGEMVKSSDLFNDELALTDLKV